MILTYKAKEDFLKYLQDLEIVPYPAMFSEVPLTIQLPYIVDWFDSIEMYFWVYRSESGYWATSIERKAKYDTRNEALISAIEDVNEIYNNNE